jgi:esterase
MATNVERDEGGYRWRFEIAALEQLLLDFFATDLWSVVEDPPEGLEVHVVKAEESSVLSGESLERVQHAARNGRTFLHRVAGGHWVNADNPEALHALLVEYLPSS